MKTKEYCTTELHPKTLLLLLFTLNLVSVCMSMGNTYHGAHVEVSGQLTEAGVSFHHAGPRDQTQCFKSVSENAVATLYPSGNRV